MEPKINLEQFSVYTVKDRNVERLAERLTGMQHRLDVLEAKLNRAIHDANESRGKLAERINTVAIGAEVAQRFAEQAIRRTVAPAKFSAQAKQESQNGAPADVVTHADVLTFRIPTGAEFVINAASYLAQRLDDGTYSLRIISA